MRVIPKGAENSGPGGDLQRFLACRSRPSVVWRSFFKVFYVLGTSAP
jgi:hypothetical protein